MFAVGQAGFEAVYLAGEVKRTEINAELPRQWAAHGRRLAEVEFTIAEIGHSRKVFPEGIEASHPGLQFREIDGEGLQFELGLVLDCLQPVGLAIQTLLDTVEGRAAGLAAEPRQIAHGHQTQG